MKRFFMAVALLACSVGAVNAQPLMIDFNSTTQDGGPHNQAGYQAYDAGHEVAADFVTQSYSAFGTTVGVTPAWPNTTAATVQQMIDRAVGNDDQWLGDKLDLVTDWIGIDSRTANGGNGDWARDGSSDPTYMTLSLSGLPAGDYNWLSYHHDTENIWSDFQAEISVDGGATYASLGDKQMTSSSTGGNPAATVLYTSGDPAALPSALTTSFSANGSDDVVLRFAPFADGVDPVAVHKQFFAMNGFEVTQVPEPSSVCMLLASLAGLGLLRKRH